MTNTKVYIRGQKKEKLISITDQSKPTVSDIMVDKWQKIIDLSAAILDVPAGLIMRITKDSMKVFVKSSNPENPYSVGGEDSLGKGLYCETVIGTDDELLIPDASQSEIWKDNPDIELDMISYLGLPIHWPDASYFGTICVLDTKYNEYTDLFKELLKGFRRVIEDDLALLTNQQQLDFLANKDHLTGCYNHEAITRKLVEELERSQRSKIYFSLIFLDVDAFSDLNKNYGYSAGDQLLKRMVICLDEEIRSIDKLGRWAGDEFVIICPSTNELGAKEIISKLEKKLTGDDLLQRYNLTCSFGVSVYHSTKDTVEYLISVARRELENAKESKL